MRNSFLYRVYYHNKKLFCFMGLFVAGTLFCNLAGFEVTPFFVWGMYSRPEKPVEEYEVLQPVADGKPIDISSGYMDNTRVYLNGPLAWYKAILDNGNTDPTLTFLDSRLKGHCRWIYSPASRVLNGPDQLAAFPDWYRGYLSSISGVPIGTLSISAVRVHYDARQHIVVDSTIFLPPWRKP
jgi:hypothetical protein